LQGKVRNCRLLEVYGYVQGEVEAEKLVVHPGGSFFGKAVTDTAEVFGTAQGTLFVKNLIAIRGNGVVSGNVQYGQIAMESGANLSAEVRNVPPAIAGDLDLTVYRGRGVGVTVTDLTALDPDDDAQHLTYTVSNAQNGYIVLADAPAQRVSSFTQADLESNRVVFRHDGTDTRQASFDVIVADHAGATSGAPRTVMVTVRPTR
jgi:cytoskeletal protein CcmA (bactofilin family)